MTSHAGLCNVLAVGGVDGDSRRSLGCGSLVVDELGGDGHLAGREQQAADRSDGGLWLDGVHGGHALRVGDQVEIS